MAISIQDVVIEVTLPDGGIIEYILEAPNSEDTPFEFGFMEVSHGGKYRDGDNVLRKAYSYYRFFARFGYHSHMMDLRWLLVAREISILFPPNFELSDYQRETVFLSNENAVRNYLSGLAVGDDMMYNDSITLEFDGINRYAWDEIFRVGFDEVPDILRWDDADDIWNESEIIWDEA